MSVIDFLSGLRNEPSEDVVTFEYRLLCSGELYNGDVIGSAWNRNAERFFLFNPFKLFVCSHPFNDYPQVIALTFQACSFTQSQGNTSYISYNDLEIAQGLSSLLTLICRRLITIAAKVR